MSTKETGGPAFPIPVVSQNQATGETSIWQTEGGMTLRDYFAGQALIGMVSRAYRADGESGIVAASCYKFADAMLAERSK